MPRGGPLRAGGGLPSSLPQNQDPGKVQKFGCPCWRKHLRGCGEWSTARTCWRGHAETLRAAVMFSRGWGAPRVWPLPSQLGRMPSALRCAHANSSRGRDTDPHKRINYILMNSCCRRFEKQVEKKHVLSVRRKPPPDGRFGGLQPCFGAANQNGVYF